jgi:hypothetical protein
MRTWKLSITTLSFLLFLNTPVLAANPSHGNPNPIAQANPSPTPTQATPTPEQPAPSPTPTAEPTPVALSPTPTHVPPGHTRPTPTPTIIPQIDFDGEVIPSPTPTEEPTPTPTPAVLGTQDEPKPPQIVQQLANKTMELIRPPLSHLFPQLSDNAYEQKRLLSPLQSLSLFALSLCFFYLGLRLLRPLLMKKWEDRLLNRRQSSKEQSWLPHYQTHP